jgi:hypothetical protein
MCKRLFSQVYSQRVSMRIWSGRSRRQRLTGSTVWGFSLAQAFVGLAILALAASVFLPAFRVQCAAAKRALQSGAIERVAQGMTQK